MNHCFTDPKKIVIGAEDPAGFAALRDQIVKDHSAEGILEILVAEQIAVNLWRLRRAQETEARVMVANDTEAALKVAAYLKNVDGAFHRAVRQLAKLQADRRKTAADLARTQAANASRACNELLERLLGPVDIPVPSEIGFVSQNDSAAGSQPVEPSAAHTIASSDTPDRRLPPKLSRDREGAVPPAPGTRLPPERTRNLELATIST
jgi:hypothetical protein